MKLTHSDGIRLLCGRLPPAFAKPARACCSSDGEDGTAYKAAPDTVGVAGTGPLDIAAAVALAVEALNVWLCDRIVVESMVTACVPAV